MDNIYETDEIKSDFECEYGSKTLTVECVIDTADSGGIGKLLSVCSRARNTSTEVCEDGVNVQNQINYMVMYTDSEGAEQCVDYLSDFSYLFPKADGFGDGYFRCEICVMDIDCETNGDSIKIQAVVETKLFGIKTVMCRCVKVDDDSVLKRCKDVCVQTFAGEIKEHFGVVEEYESGGSIHKILCFDSEAIVKKVNIGNDKITVSGEIVATVSYICDNALTNKSFNISFSEEIKTPKADMDCDNLKANLFADIADKKVILSGSAENNIMCLQFNVRVCGALYSAERVQAVVDMYSSTQELALEYCGYSGYCYEGVLQISDKIYGSAVIRDDMMPGRKIITTNIARNCIANIYYENNKIFADGVLTCNVVYEDIDANTVTCVVEVPYSVEADKDGLSEGYAFCGSVAAELMNTKIKGDREIEVSAMLCVMVSMHKPIAIDCVSGVKVGAVKDTESYAVTIYSPSDCEDLWDIAKNINAPMEEILKQNPALKDGCCAKVVFYRQI